MSARSSAAMCRRASPCSDILRKRWGSSRAICCGDLDEKAEPELRADQGPDILQQHEEVHGIAGRSDEIEAFVEGPCLIIFGVDGEGPKAGDLGRRQRPDERVLQKAGPDPFSGPSAVDRETGEDHQGNRMPGDALAQPLRRILVSYVPERQRVEADNLVP